MVKDNDQGFWQGLWRESIKAMVLGWDLAVPIFAGVLIGYFLDKYLGTVYIFTIGLLVAGIAVGYYNIARFIRRLDRVDEERDDEEKTYKVLDDEEEEFFFDEESDEDQL